YGNVTGTDGALSKREKALIALAVSHAQKCPYCIDAYTTQCLENGANPEQMMEAVHVAAVMQAGGTLGHPGRVGQHLNQAGRCAPGERPPTRRGGCWGRGAPRPARPAPPPP